MDVMKQLTQKKWSWMYYILKSCSLSWSIQHLS